MCSQGISEKLGKISIGIFCLLLSFPLTSLSMSNKSKSIEFVFCKFHFTQNLFSYSINQLIKDIEYAQTKNVTDSTDNVWHIGGITKSTIDKESFVFGKLGKEGRRKKDSTWDEQKKDFIDIEDNTKRADYARFVIDIGSYIIAIEQKYFISPKSFIKKFLQFIPQERQPDVFLDFLTDKENVYTKIASWEFFESAKFTLRPTNQDSDQDFSQLDKLVGDTGAGKAKIDFGLGNDTQKKSLSKKGKNVIQMAIAVASAGYGKFTLIGKNKDGETEKVISKNKRLRKKITINDSFDMVGAIKKAIASIRNRG